MRINNCIYIKYLQSINKSKVIKGKFMRYLGKLLSRVATDLSFAISSRNQTWLAGHFTILREDFHSCKSPIFIRGFSRQPQIQNKETMRLRLVMGILAASRGLKMLGTSQPNKATDTWPLKVVSPKIHMVFFS